MLHPHICVERHDADVGHPEMHKVSTAAGAGAIISAWHMWFIRLARTIVRMRVRCLVTIEDGRATKIAGNPDHPVTRGFLCGKVAKYLDRVYSADRLLYPMRRTAPKGQGCGGPAAFERISWDEALGEIAQRLAAVAEEFGPEAILPYSYGGTLGQIHGSGMDRRFFHRLGASQLERTICSAGGRGGADVR